jgi:hypothetical protein
MRLISRITKNPIGAVEWARAAGEADGGGLGQHQGNEYRFVS